MPREREAHYFKHAQTLDVISSILRHVPSCLCRLSLAASFSSPNILHGEIIPIRPRQRIVPEISQVGYRQRRPLAFRRSEVKATIVRWLSRGEEPSGARPQVFQRVWQMVGGEKHHSTGAKPPVSSGGRRHSARQDGK